MGQYIWQCEGWPRMSWDGKAFSSLLAEVNMLRGKLMCQTKVPVTPKTNKN